MTGTYSTARASEIWLVYLRLNIQPMTVIWHDVSFMDYLHCMSTAGSGRFLTEGLILVILVIFASKIGITSFKTGKCWF